MARARRTPGGRLVKAVYWALNVPAIRQTLGAGVYGDVPQGAALPYLRINADDAIPWNTMGRAGNEADIVIDIFAATGRVADDIADAVVLLLAGAPLAVEGYDLDGGLQYQQSPRGEDEIINGVRTFHRVVRFHAFLLETV